jgi:hypothetical protein
MSESDPNVWSGRALQENFHRVGGCAVLHQCIRPLIGAVLLRAIMGISARAISLAVRPQRAVGVTSARMRREDRSSISFLILSQTSAGKAFSTIRVESRGLNLAGLEGSPMS